VPLAAPGEPPEDVIEECPALGIGMGGGGAGEKKIKKNNTKNYLERL
jgi:hypothetical protein